jgi:hypothetical protein
MGHLLQSTGMPIFDLLVKVSFSYGADVGFRGIFSPFVHVGGVNEMIIFLMPGR